MTFNWTIKSLGVKPTNGKLSNTVITVYWECSAVDGEFSDKVCSVCPLPEPTTKGYISYESLTDIKVLEWIWACGVDKDTVEAEVSQKIDAKKNPPIVYPPLPWA